MRFRLRTLMIALAIGPPFAAAWFYSAGVWEYIGVAMVVSGAFMVVIGALLWKSSFATGNR